MQARWRKWLVGLAMVLAAVAAMPATASAKKDYVSLGDSFTAGPLIPNQIPPYGCLKSDHNYPHLAAPHLPVAGFRDASCSGAETEDMTQPQNVRPGPNPPQFDRLDANTTIVTVTIGGNDIGFSEIAENCSSTTPTGTPCQDRYNPSRTPEDDEISRRIRETAPKIAAVIKGIQRRSPRAKIYFLNYLPILPDQGRGCWPRVPVTEGDTREEGDVPYLRDKHKELNAMIAEQARLNGANVIDAYSEGASGNHDACQLVPTERWVEPAAPTLPAAPLHPNQFGMEAMARMVRQAAGG